MQETFNPDGRPITAKPLFFIAMGAVVLAVFSLAFTFAGKAIIDRQKEAIFLEKIRAGRLLVAHLSESAVFPLLGEDVATLSRLVRRPPDGGNILFIAITDGGNVIRAHTDLSRIGEILRLPPSAKDQGTEDGVAWFSYPLPSAGQAIDLSRPLVIRNKAVGSVHVAFAREALDREAEVAAGHLRRFLMGLGALTAAAILGLVILSAFGLSTSWRFVNPRRAEGDEEGPAYRVMAIRDGPGGDRTEAPSGEEAHSPPRSVLRKALSIVGYPAEPAKGAAEPETPPAPRVARNQATVLVSNIREFRTYADSHRPEEILEGLNSYFEIAEGVIVAHGGRVGNFSGDTVVAVFGGTTFLPDHTSRAVRAALSLQMALREEGEGSRPLLKQVAIGISSGVILSCEVGASHGTGPVMIGESFKSAEALATMAGPGEIVIGREIYQYLGSTVSVDPLPPREILDRTGSWENFRLQDGVKRRA